MGSNPPIKALPITTAQPKLHIARFLDSIRPFAAEHAYRGLLYFHRSRLGGDHLSLEDTDPSFTPPDLVFPPASSTLASNLASGPSRSPQTPQSALASTLSSLGLVIDAARAADGTTRLRLRSSSNNTKTVDHDRGKHNTLRRVSGATQHRSSPYTTTRHGTKGGVGIGDDLHKGLGLGLGLPMSPPRPDFSGAHDLGATIGGPDPASLGIEFVAAAQQQHHHAHHAHRNALPSSPSKLAATAGSAQRSPQRLPTLHQSAPEAVQAAVRRLAAGIFARGVSSQPVQVASPQTQTQGAVPFQVDEKQFRGLAAEAPQSSPISPFSFPSLGLLPPLNGGMRMGSSSWPLATANQQGAQQQQQQQQQQTPPATASFLREDAPPALDTMMSFYMGWNETQPSRPDASSAFRSGGDVHTDLTNLVSPVDPTPSPLDGLDTGLRPTVPQGTTEQRAVSADPPRCWDLSSSAFAWSRPLSAPPSRPAPIKEEPVSPQAAPLPTPKAGADNSADLFAFGPFSDWFKEQPAKPKDFVAFPLPASDGLDASFDLKQWPQLSDNAAGLNWLPSPPTQPAPYTYGFSPQAADGTLHPSASSPFPIYTPHDSPYDGDASRTPQPAMQLEPARLM